jgi:hypothetical protein
LFNFIENQILAACLSPSFSLFLALLDLSCWLGFLAAHMSSIRSGLLIFQPPIFICEISFNHCSCFSRHAFAAELRPGLVFAAGQGLKFRE